MNVKKITILTLSILAVSSSGGLNVKADSFTDFIDEDTAQRYSDKEVTEDDVKNIKILFTDEEETYAKIALDFAKSFLDTDGISVSEMIPIYNAHKEFVGYNCKITLNGIDNGYIIVDNRLTDDWIAEFNLDLNQSDPYTELVEKIGKESVDTIDDSEKIMIESETTVYNVNVDDTIISTAGDVKDSDEFMGEISIAKSSPYGHSGDVLKEYPTTYQFVKFKSVGQFVDLTQRKVEEVSSSFACSVTAMTILAEKTGIAPKSTWDNATIKNTYNKLWKYSNTTVYNNAISYGKNVKYGETYDSKLIPAMKQLAKDNKKTINGYQKYNPSWKDMQGQLDSNRNFIFGYSATNGKSGHSVATQGYYIGKKGNSTHNFLIVANGWTVGAKYLNYSNDGKYLTQEVMTSFW